MVGVVIHDCLFDVLFVFGKVCALVANASSGAQNAHKYFGIENPNRFFSENIRSRTDIHDFARGIVYLLYFEFLVKHDKSVGSVVYDAVGKTLGFLLCFLCF